MTHWIDGRIAEQKERDGRKRKIEAEAPKIFDALWSYIEADVNHFNGTGHIGFPGLGMEGNSSTRHMIIYQPAARERKEMFVVLERDFLSIRIGGEVSMRLFVRICKDGSVCLQDENHQKIEFKEAAREILDPFLFPTLNKPEFPSKS